MGELIYKTNVHQDWISIFFFINLFLIVVLHYINPSRFIDIIKVFSSRVYFGKYAKDHNFRYSEPFNIVCFLFVTNTLAFFLLSLNNYIFLHVVYAFKFYYLLGALFTMISIRFVFIQFIITKLELTNKTNVFQFKSFTHNTQAAFFLQFILFINYYTKEIYIALILVIFFAIVALWSFYQLKILFSFIKPQLGNLFYLIFYICTIKIAPWIWLYFLFIEPRL